MLQRNLLYTALTRAKRLAVFVGTKKTIAIAVKNNKIDVRTAFWTAGSGGLIEQGSMSAKASWTAGSGA